MDAVPCSALTRRCVGLLLYVSELRAGAAFVPAGCSSGTGVVRAGPVCAAVRPYRGVLRSGHACRAALSRRFAFGSRLLFDARAKQDGLRKDTFLFRRGSVSPVVRSQIDGAVIGLGRFISGLCVSLWRSRRRTKGRGNAENGGDGERSRRRGVSALLREHIGFEVFSAGSTLGLRAPDCAKEPLALWTLFIWVVMWVRFTRRRALGYNGDLPNSNLWFGKSCGRIIAPMRASL